MTARRCRPLRERLWAKLDRSGGPEACWPFRGATKTSRGGALRGKIRIAGRGSRYVTAARVALALATDGILRRGLEAAHTCDTPLCCNPRHLFWASHKSNMQDYARKHGRIAVPKRAVVPPMEAAR